ncbi:hypothetical protein Pmani_008827 [Petrolisthes manimaculis]|uniref:Uncharacterized protein n=1 Tax=Petrolisthes manimaculis TaxID=1843537 RepID=A0AAE1Q642_9EUCA|nr:hypothetical protein Pmani_008827 [Petrolisthes manimaculis]
MFNFLRTPPSSHLPVGHKSRGDLSSVKQSELTIILVGTREDISSYVLHLLQFRDQTYLSPEQIKPFLQPMQQDVYTKTEPWEKDNDDDEEEDVVVEGEIIPDKITGFAQDTAAVVVPPDFLLTFQTIRRVNSDEVSDITRQLERMEEFQDPQE